MRRISVLATDMDGTFIPLDSNQQNLRDLELLSAEIGQQNLDLVYVTGRHYELVLDAINSYALPSPQWLICDVGSSIYESTPPCGHQILDAYHDQLAGIVGPCDVGMLESTLATVVGIEIQEPEKQGRFKLSYYCDSRFINEITTRLSELLDSLNAPYRIIFSVDPFNGDGLIDLLPKGVSKDYALHWWVQHAGLSRDAIVYAGDSDNDFAALSAGYRTIVVGNADRAIARRVYEAHKESDWKNRLYLARSQATSGVLEGCRWFGLLAQGSLPVQRLGATPVTHTETHFRVWAPQRQSVTVEVDRDGKSKRQALTRQEDGYFVGNVLQAEPGSRYRYVLDDAVVRPDPASNFQPEGVHGASQVVDHGAFPWTDQNWHGVAKRDLIIYELHIGAFTQAGTFRAAIDRIGELSTLGVTAVEIMPVAQSPGRWNWGYDGVDLFAVRNTYGEPDDLKAFVDACHSAGLAVILDVVYNHIGPEGNYLAEFGPYFSRKHHTPWGAAFNFDDSESEHVRRFVVENAIFWLDTYHFDGLRLDAVHFIQDDSEITILDQIRRSVADYRESAGRTLHLIAETNVHDEDLLKEQDDRPAYDAIWCDCLMHSIYSHAVPDLRLTNREYKGASDLAASLNYGYVFEGRKQERVSARSNDKHPADHQRRSVESFVIGLQTHDSIGNHPHGKRIHQLTSKAFQKAAAGLTLLYPGIPLLFMGEEHAVESVFSFFVDFEDAQLRQAVDQGRAREYPQQVWGRVLSASDANAFYRAKCDQPDNDDREMFEWYRELISLRKKGLAQRWLAIHRMSSDYNEADDVFVLRYECDDGGIVCVKARLATAASPTTAVVPLEGSILLSSQPNPRIVDGQISLQQNHVVITQKKGGVSPMPSTCSTTL